MRYFNVFKYLVPALALAITGCTTGPMQVEETYYLRATNGQDNAYFRVNVKGNTAVSVSQFRQGWYPEDAVDSLFGDISTESTQGIVTRETLRKQVDEAVIKTNRQYLVKAKNPDTKPEELKKYLTARNRVLFAPDSSLGKLEQTSVMEYNPGEDLIVRRDGMKLVFFLSSDPDKIIGQMSRFAEDQKTQAEVHKLTNMMVNNSRAKVIGEQAVADVERKMDGLIFKQLEHTIKALTTKKVEQNPDLTAEKQNLPKRKEAMEALDVLINLLNSSLHQGGNQQ